MRNKLYIFALIGFSFLVSCSETKYVAEGDYLLDKVNVEIDKKTEDINTAKMKSYIRQRGNSRWFSAVKIPLATYSLSGRDSTLWLNRMLKSIGEAPVIYDSVSARLTCNDLRNALQNEGYLGAYVDMRHDTKRKKKNVVYVLHPGEPYYIGQVKYEINDSAIAQLLGMDNASNRQLYPGMQFNVEALNQERKRITDQLTSNGYYRFHKDFISYQADTVNNKREIGLTLVLHPYRTNTISDTLHTQYRIGKIQYQSGDPDDSVIHLRKAVIARSTFITENSLYSTKDLQKTYNRFGRLQAVKYTNISFKEHPGEPVLDCDIQLSTNKPSMISFQPEGTNTAGDLGAAASLTYLNRNIFRGSEQFSVELRGAYEAIKGLEGYSNADFLEYSVETKLTFPRFVAPFLASSFRRRINATSEVSLSYNLQDRPEYHRRVTSAAWKYKWHDANHHDRYQIDFLDLNYVSMPWISEKFKQDYLESTTNRNAILRYNYEDLFIMKFGVGFIYNSGIYAVKANVETAGNVLDLGARIFHFSKNDLGQYRLFRIAYAQYVKGDFEYTKNIQFDYNNSLVFHAGLGVAYPYGNSRVLPFEKRYFSGGANSVRGWAVRSLGPGKYMGSNGNIDFINQTGDMKIDLNLEYRAHLFWKLNGALFVDAGNIWTLRSYEEQPGGAFRLKDFWKEIAVSYGLGLRFNFDYFILRFDMGMKAINPAYESGAARYPAIHPKLSRDFAFHFAVGHPF
jgi:outer membrane protein assembly factor BamA